MFYQEIFQALHRAGVRYLVAGGVALNLHGVPRMTADLDLAVALDRENLEAALDALAGQGLRPSLPVPARDVLDPAKRARWREEKNLVAFPLHSPTRPFEAVDLLIHADLDFEAAWGRRLAVQVAGVEVPVLGLDDLVALKRRAGRPQDLADADALLRLKARTQGNP